jgi:hypothetical protein
MKDEKYIQGTPSAVLLPAKNYIFRITNEHFIIELPRKGNYHDIAPDFFPEDSGEFNIFDDESRILYMPAITKVLFAAAKYPDLKFNQFFTPYSIKIEDEVVVVVGMIIDMVLPIRDNKITEVKESINDDNTVDEGTEE